MARVLIVDDSIAVRNILKRELEDLGHDVAGETPGGDEAVRLFLKLVPDLVLMDITLEGADGFELIRRIRAAAPRVRIIIVSVLPLENVKDEAQALGIDGYPGKPFSSEELRLALGGLP
jgi:two-component system chemotaxis response regulator CheY